MARDDRMPIIIGVGEFSEQIGAPDYAALSPADLAGRAAALAVLDTGSGPAVADAIDTIASIRQFEISTPAAVAPFGCSNNFPRSVARRIGANPARAVLEVTGGQGPQHLVGEFAAKIMAGTVETVLLVGSEAISTVRHLQSKGETPDWSEQVEGELEDRGYALEAMWMPYVFRHGLRTPIQIYAILENARRKRLGLSREAYATEMGRLFAPFSEAAARNPHAMSREARSVEEIATPTERNRMLSDPFPRFVVSRDQANQAAAVILTSVGRARALGVPEDRWVYLHGHADAKERMVMDRQDMGAYPAAVAAAERALAQAGITAADLGVIDFYSCFPVAVFGLCDGLGISPADPRGLTVTGGLPFFGGAGNNYSMHALAEVIGALRARPGAFGFVGANGGFLSKYSVGVYSTRPAHYQPDDSKALQAEIDGWAAPEVVEEPEGEGVVETYTIDYQGAGEPKPVIVGRLANGARFMAAAAPGSAEVQIMLHEDPLGRAVRVTKAADPTKGMNLFTFV